MAENKKTATKTPEIGSGVDIETATLDELTAKPAPTRSCTIVVEVDGVPVERRIVFQAISPERYQEIVDDHPPTRKQAKDGLEYDPEPFSIALIAECSLRPKIPQAKIVEMRDSGRWTRGELGLMFRTAVEVNHGGLEIPFTSNGSG